MDLFKKIQFCFILLLVPFAGICQDGNPVNTKSYFSSALFLALLVTIILLAILIVAVSSAFKNIADSDYLINKFNKEKESESSAPKIVTTVILMLSSFALFSQENVAKVINDDGRIGGLDYFTFYFMIAIIVLELAVLALMFYQFNFLIRTTKAVTETKKKESKLIQSLVGAVAVENEDSILLDHDYDGIRELDNDLPPWWKYGFYLTIAVSVIYMLHFHVLGTGDLQLKEYENDIAEAKLAVDEYMRNSANNVDENTVKLMTEQGDLQIGKEVFIANCAACHGKAGEGSVGPNLTDDYWLHGGSIQDVFKSVKYGWVEKGMKSWKEDLSPMQIAQITSFIKSLKGTNPANAKAYQGDIFMEDAVALNDSTTIKTDSLLIAKDSTGTILK
ncbi:MAG: cbb3-type cytochrome c oxidase N-terminal domain-containing protein [Bacteroidota bacterium]